MYQQVTTAKLKVLINPLSMVIVHYLLVSLSADFAAKHVHFVQIKLIV